MEKESKEECCIYFRTRVVCVIVWFGRSPHFAFFLFNHKNRNRASGSVFFFQRWYLLQHDSNTVPDDFYI